MNINEEIVRAYLNVITEGVIGLKFTKGGDLAVSVKSGFPSLTLSCPDDADLKSSLKRELGAVTDLPSLKNVIHKHFFEEIGIDELVKMVTSSSSRP